MEYKFHLAEMFIVYTRRETFSRLNESSVDLIRIFQASDDS